MAMCIYILNQIRRGLPKGLHTMRPPALPPLLYPPLRTPAALCVPSLHRYSVTKNFIDTDFDHSLNFKKTTTAHCSVPMLTMSKRRGGPISLMVAVPS